MASRSLRKLATVLTADNISGHVTVIYVSPLTADKNQHLLLASLRLLTVPRSLPLGFQLTLHLPFQLLLSGPIGICIGIGISLDKCASSSPKNTLEPPKSFILKADSVHILSSIISAFQNHLPIEYHLHTLTPGLLVNNELYATLCP